MARLTWGLGLALAAVVSGCGGGSSEPVGTAGPLRAASPKSSCSRVFTEAPSATAVQNATGLATGDFDEDGNLDLVVSNYVDGAGLLLLLGQGDGTFAAPVTVTRKPLAYQVATADFDGDGHLDVAYVWELGDGWGLRVRHGRGDGTFGPENDLTRGSGNSSLLASDLDGDGRPDLAIGDAKVVKVMLRGEHGFGPEAPYRDPSTPWALAAADVNGDGTTDLLVTNGASNDLSVFPGNGDGTFGKPLSVPVGEFQFGMAVADFNADGAPDLAVEAYADGRVLLGHGDGTFTVSGPLLGDYLVSGVVTSDFNGDGNVDIAWAINQNADISLFLGKGDGTFTQTTTYGGAPASYPVVGDFNSDGRPDIAVAQRHEVTVLLDNCP